MTPRHVNRISFVVAESEAGSRLDIIVASRHSDFSRTMVTGLIRAGVIQVDDTVKKPGYQVVAGNRVEGTIPPPDPVTILPEPIPFTVLYEDDAIVVIDKPPGLVVHPAPGHYSGTLVNGLLHRYPELTVEDGYLRPGIVHRLDRNTSGVMVTTRTSYAKMALSGQFKNRTVKKSYIAIVQGQIKPGEGSVSLPIGRHPVHRKKMAVNAPHARMSETLWRTRKRYLHATLLDVFIKTGRTHQIRVHLSHSGFPVAGDEVYGGRMTKHGLKDDRGNIIPVGRQMLHAHRLTFHHPVTGKEVRFSAPVPPDMRIVISRLEPNPNKE